MQPAKWQTANKGKARQAFTQAANQSVVQQQKTRSGSEMVKNTQPKPLGPKPPSFTRAAVDRQVHSSQLSAEDKKAREAQKAATVKPTLTREEKVAQFNARLKQAKEKDMGR